MAKRWYVVHVYSGFEKKIAQQIKEQAAQKGLADQFDEVLVPSEARWSARCDAARRSTRSMSSSPAMCW